MEYYREDDASYPDLYYITRESTKGSLNIEFARESNNEPFAMIRSTLVCADIPTALPDGYLDRSKTLSLQPGGLFLEMISPDALCELAADQL